MLESLGTPDGDAEKPGSPDGDAANVAQNSLRRTRRLGRVFHLAEIKCRNVENLSRCSKKHTKK